MEIFDTGISFWKGLSITPNADSRFTCMPKDATTYNIGDEFSVICDKACRFARELTTVSIPATVKCIGKSAFSCPELKEIKFQTRSAEDELYIKEKAFADTPKLTSLVLPLGKIKFEGKVFGITLKKLRLQGPPQDFCKETFKSASSLKTITVDREYLQQYREIIGKWFKNIQFQPYIPPEEIKTARMAQKEHNNEVKIQAEKERQRQKRYATVRLNIPVNQNCEIRLGKSNLAKTQTLVSESNLIVNIEVVFDGTESSIEAKNFKISKHIYWDDLCYRASDHVYEGIKGKEADWIMADEAPLIARECFANLAKGSGDLAAETIKLLGAARDDYEKKYDNPEIYPFWLEKEPGESITLEYRLRLPDEFDPKKLIFFSMRGRDIENTDCLCRGLSRWAKQPKYDAEQVKRHLKEMNIDDFDERRHLPKEGRAKDDNILWLDFIGYDRQFGTLRNIIWDNAPENKDRYDRIHPEKDEVDDKEVEEEVDIDEDIQRLLSKIHSRRR